MTQHELFTQIVYWLHNLENVTTSITNVTTSITDDELTIKSIDNQVIVKHHSTLADERRYLLQYTNQLINGVLEIYSNGYREWIIQCDSLSTDKTLFDRFYLLALLGDEVLMDRLFLLEQVN